MFFLQPTFEYKAVSSPEGHQPRSLLPDMEATNSGWLIDDSETVNTDDARLDEQNMRFIHVEADEVIMVSKLSGVNSERIMRLRHGDTPPERISANSGTIRDRQRYYRRFCEAGHNRSDATTTEWNTPRPSLAMPQSQKHDNRVSQNGCATPPSTRSKCASKRFHHSPLPSDKQRTSLVLPPDGGGVNRPALLTGRALSSLPFASEYLDNITSGLRDIYTDSSMIDEFTSLPMSRPSAASPHEYDTSESFTPGAETMFATRTELRSRDGETVSLVDTMQHV